MFGSSTLSGSNGVRGEVTGANAYGVSGISSSSNGVYGQGFIGVSGKSILSGGNGVRGEATAANAYGVAGIGGLIGVYGKSSLSGGNGVRGEATGANAYGVAGYAPSGRGVYGYGASGVWGFTDFIYGNGIRGEASGTFANGIYGSSTFSYAGYFAGNVYCSGLYLGSDRTLKQDISDVTSAIEIIKKLQPKSYTFRQDGNYKSMNLPRGKHYGLIAQDVEQVLPNLVKATTFINNKAEIGKESNTALKESSAIPPTETIEFKALNYTELIPIMIKAIQEQEAKIETLTQQVNKLSQKDNASLNLSNASLDQNIPNPFTNSTSIGYTLPEKVRSAQIIIIDMNGKRLKTINVSGSGKGILHVNTSTLPPGSYNYSLVIDGKMIGSKQMIMVK